MQDLASKVGRLEERLDQESEAAREFPLSLKRLNDEMFNTQLQFEEKIKGRERDLEEMAQSLRSLSMEQNRLGDDINKKEDKVEAEKLIKETAMLRDKNCHLENELKLAIHKIEKMEILSEKADRLQAKKDIEFMREIQERVKQEVKGTGQGTIRNLPSLSQAGSPPLQPSQHTIGMNSSALTPKLATQSEC